MGNWRNYDDLEENLSIDELIATIDAYRKRQKEEHRFLAAIQGVDLGQEEAAEINITDVSPYDTAQEGFGVGLGLGHVVEYHNVGGEDN